MAEQEKMHMLTDYVYKNILEGVNPKLRQLLVTGRAYQKALHGVSSAAKAYIDSMTSLASVSKQSKGATSDIGAALLQIAEVQREINTQSLDMIKSFHAELLIPLESKQDSELKQINLQYKKYLQGRKIFCSPYEKAQSNLKKYRKKIAKTKMGFDPKEMQLLRTSNEYQAKLEEYQRSSLRQALLEDHSRHCFLLDKLCVMVRNYASYHNKAHELLTHRLPEWGELCKQPNVLPEGTEALLREYAGSHHHSNSESVYDMPTSNQQQQQQQDVYHTHNSTYPHNAPHTMEEDPYGHHQQQRKTHSDEEYKRRSRDFERRLSQENIIERSHYGQGSSQSMPRTITVPPPPPSGRPQARALYTHVGTGDNQLSFTEGDIVTLIGDKKDGWQYGENTRTGRYGWFPISFTEPMNTGQDNRSHQRPKSAGDMLQVNNSDHSSSEHEYSGHVTRDRSGSRGDRPKSMYGILKSPSHTPVSQNTDSGVWSSPYEPRETRQRPQSMYDEAQLDVNWQMQQPQPTNQGVPESRTSHSLPGHYAAPSVPPPPQHPPPRVHRSHPPTPTHRPRSPHVHMQQPVPQGQGPQSSPLPHRLPRRQSFDSDLLPPPPPPPPLPQARNYGNNYTNGYGSSVTPSPPQSGSSYGSLQPLNYRVGSSTSSSQQNIENHHGGPPGHHSNQHEYYSNYDEQQRRKREILSHM